MKIQCLIKRKNGSTVVFGERDKKTKKIIKPVEYKFLPENDHVCEVEIESHIETFLNNPSFTELGKEPRIQIEEDPGYEIVDDFDESEDLDDFPGELESSQDEEPLLDWAIATIGDNADDMDAVIEYAKNNYGLKLPKTMKIETMWQRVRDADSD